MCFLRLQCLLAYSVFLFGGGSALAGQVMVPAPGGGYTIAPITDSYGSCRLDLHYQPVPHAGAASLRHLLDRMAPYAGFRAEAYTVDLIEDLRGYREINAMTCAGSQAIWLSVTAYEDLADSEVSLAYILAHEVLHGPGQVAAGFPRAWLDADSQAYYHRLNGSQRKEVRIDLASADLLVRMGYRPDRIAAGARYILQRPSAVNLLRQTATHPAGWDRVTLLEAYLQRRYGNRPPAAVAGRVVPRY